MAFGEYPTHDEVLAAVAVLEPCAVMDVAGHFDMPWGSRQTARNRLMDLVERGELIVDEDRRPMLFAINQLKED